MTGLPSNASWIAKTLGVIVFLLVVVPLAVAAFPSLVGADESFVVLTSSMSPAIKAGDLVVVNDIQTSEIEEGDVITFRRSAAANTVTHRVVEVSQEDATILFTTKGDANEQPDTESVPASRVIGEVWFSIPFVGYIVAFGNTQLGLISLLIVPGFLLAVSELWDMYTDSDLETRVK